MERFFDVVIVGAGVAGLSALLAVDPLQRVAVINPGSPLKTGSTWRAQGGVAVALGGDDTPALHAADTIAASRQMADDDLSPEARLLAASASDQPLKAQYMPYLERVQLLERAIAVWPSTKPDARPTHK